MDTQAHFEPFRRLLARLVDTAGKGKPLTDELIESWWQVLRWEKFEDVKANIETFLATATKGTPFPLPADMKPKAGPVVVGNPVRDFWRSTIFGELSNLLGYRGTDLYPHMAASRPMAEECVKLMNEICERESQTGRTHQLHHDCSRRCEGIARASRHLAKPNAPILMMLAGAA